MNKCLLNEPQRNDEVLGTALLQALTMGHSKPITLIIVSRDGLKIFMDKGLLNVTESHGQCLS